MRIFAATLAVLTWYAVGLQTYLSVKLALSHGGTITSGLIRNFGYFTVLTNLLVAVVLTFHLWLPHSRPGRFFSRVTVRSATALYIATVAATYSLLLREIWNPQGLQKLADVLLHDAIPVLYVIYWLAFVPKGTLRWKHILPWLGYPLIYCAYSLLHGATTGYYPYPFIDVSKLGYGRAMGNALALVVAFLAGGTIMVALDIWMGRGQSGIPVRTDKGL